MFYNQQKNWCVHDVLKTNCPSIRDELYSNSFDRHFSKYTSSFSLYRENTSYFSKCVGFHSASHLVTALITTSKLSCCQRELLECNNSDRYITSPFEMGFPLRHKKVCKPSFEPSIVEEDSWRTVFWRRMFVETFSSCLLGIFWRTHLFLSCCSNILIESFWKSPRKPLDWPLHDFQVVIVLLAATVLLALALHNRTLWSLCWLERSVLRG